MSEIHSIIPVMIMSAPDSLARNGFRGKGEEEVGDQGEGAAKVSIGLFRSMVLDKRENIKYGWNCRVNFHRKGRGG